MKYATIDPDTGVIIALHDSATDDTLPISDEEMQAHLSGDMRYWDGGQWVPLAPPPEVIDARIIGAAEQRIDAIADQVYTSSVSRGARYERKYAEAIRYRDAGHPGTVSAGDYPYLVEEAAARGLTKRQLADAIIAAAQAYNTFGALAEAKRAQLKTDVPAAADEAAKQAAADALVAGVQQAAQALQK